MVFFLTLILSNVIFLAQNFQVLISKYSFKFKFRFVKISAYYKVQVTQNLLKLSIKLRRKS